MQLEISSGRTEAHFNEVAIRALLVQLQYCILSESLSYCRESKLMGRGFKQYALGPILMLYAQKSSEVSVQTVVQVIYYEQQRLRDVMDGSQLVATGTSPALVPSNGNHQFLQISASCFRLGLESKTKSGAEI
ncbi:hypothetical protein HAX54_047495 [Datura stramonium]|uniref:Uncharacterized protein n=1 Tax=Datura stramonium TaxID=4076 RepID=A0ABS8WM69_DATST|nr:hypothetical protein [Datura stramonium]